MKSGFRKKLWAIAIIVGALLVFFAARNPTVHGLIEYKFLTWEEDAFVGKPLAELEAHLKGKRKSLHRMGGGEYLPRSAKASSPHVQTYRFRKSEYPWFIGSVVNLGYAVVERDGEVDRIVEILREGELDSL